MVSMAMRLAINPGAHRWPKGVFLGVFHRTPKALARAMACVRLSTPSFPKILFKCFLTVPTARKSSMAISLFDCSIYHLPGAEGPHAPGR
jgi:hypothetical protein